MKLLCPICNRPLVRNGNSAKCESNHSFDYAKEGYLNLFIKESVNHGDDKEMVRARTAFLNTGSYNFLRSYLQEIIQKEDADVLVDLGCGEGYYTSTFQAKEKYGFDVSKLAIKYASKHDPSTNYCVGSSFHVPMESESTDIIVTCFAPVAKDEITRLLKQDGCFIVVTPGADHLIELKECLYDEVYKNEVKDIDIDLRKESEVVITNTFEITNQNILDLFAMTPYAHTTSNKAKQKLEKIEKIRLTASFVVRVYRKH